MSIWVCDPRGRTGRGAYVLTWLGLAGSAIAVSQALQLDAPNVQVAAVAVALALLWTAISVTTRRLHDAGRSGWWQAIPTTASVVGLSTILAGPDAIAASAGIPAAAVWALAGVLPLFLAVLVVMPTEAGGNRYGLARASAAPGADGASRSVDPRLGKVRFIPSDIAVAGVGPGKLGALLGEGTDAPRTTGGRERRVFDTGPVAGGAERRGRSPSIIGPAMIEPVAASRSSQDLDVTEPQQTMPTPERRIRDTGPPAGHHERRGPRLTGRPAPAELATPSAPSGVADRRIRDVGPRAGQIDRRAPRANVEQVARPEGGETALRDPPISASDQRATGIDAAAVGKFQETPAAIGQLHTGPERRRKDAGPPPGQDERRTKPAFGRRTRD